MERAAPDERDRILVKLFLPREALIELVVQCRLGLRVELALPGISHLPHRRARAGAMRGGDVGASRWVRISRTLGASVMKAMMRRIATNDRYEV